MYWYYQSIFREYNDPLYIDSIKKYIDCQNIKNTFYGGLVLGLLVSKYSDYKVSHKALMKLHRPMEFLVLVPICLAFSTLSFQNYSRSHAVYGTLLGDAALMFGESLLVNAGILPFWLFTIRYYQHVFDCGSIFFLTFGLNNLKSDIESYPENYLHLV